MRRSCKGEPVRLDSLVNPDINLCFIHTISWGEKIPRVKYTDTYVDLMERMMRADAVGEGKQAMIRMKFIIQSPCEFN